MIRAIFLAVTILASLPVSAEELSLEQTNKLIAPTLARINQKNLEIQEAMPANKNNPTWYEEKINGLIQEATDLGTALSDNPYVTMTGFSAGFPWGVTFDFEFKKGSSAGNLPQ